MYTPKSGSFNVNATELANSLSGLINDLENQHLQYGYSFGSDYDAAFTNITESNLCFYLATLANSQNANFVVLSQSACESIGIKWGKEVIKCNIVNE